MATNAIVYSVLRISLAALSAFSFGGLWYGPPGFIVAWKREQERAGRVFPKKGAYVKHGTMTWVCAISAAYVTAIAISYVLAAAGITSVTDAALHGAAYGAAFVATSFGINYAFSGYTLTLWLIDASYHIVQFAVTAAILAAMPL